MLLPQRRLILAAPLIALLAACGGGGSSASAPANVTVVAELANGKVITGRNMWTVDAQEVKTTDATFPVRWEGISVEEA